MPAPPLPWSAAGAVPGAQGQCQARVRGPAAAEARAGLGRTSLCSVSDSEQDAELHRGSRLAALTASRRPPGRARERETHLERGCAAGAGLGERAGPRPLGPPGPGGCGVAGARAAARLGGREPPSRPGSRTGGPTLAAPAQQPRSPSEGGRSPAPHALFVFLARLT